MSRYFSNSDLVLPGDARICFDEIFTYVRPLRRGLRDMSSGLAPGQEAFLWRDVGRRGMFLLNGSATILRMTTCMYPDVLLYADQVPEVERHRFCMSQSKAAYLEELLEEQFGKAAVYPGTRYLVLHLQMQSEGTTQ